MDFPALGVVFWEAESTLCSNHVELVSDIFCPSESANVGGATVKRLREFCCKWCFFGLTCFCFFLVFVKVWHLAGFVVWREFSFFFFVILVQVFDISPIGGRPCCAAARAVDFVAPVLCVPVCGGSYPWSACHAFFCRCALWS